MLTKELMIPESSPLPQTFDWKDSLANCFRRLDDLLEFCDVAHLLPHLVSEGRFPFRVTRYYASLIEKGNPNDPLLLQVLPDVREIHQVAGYGRDPVGDCDSVVMPGLLHKYHGRVLLTLTSACAIHCRYCFRQHFPYQDNIADIGRHGELMHYISTHQDVNEVILSGGDPLILDNRRLQELVDTLNGMQHVRTLRIHSRLMSVLPERIDPELIQILQSFHGHVVLVSHINHPAEIDDINRQALRSLAQNGLRLFNQSVLLKRINDDTELLQSLSHELFASGVTPYYLHRLDKVQGAAHFDITDERACQIYRTLQRKLPGYLLPKMVREIPGEKSKSTVHCY